MINDLVMQLKTYLEPKHVIDFVPKIWIFRKTTYTITQQWDWHNG